MVSRKLVLFLVVCASTPAISQKLNHIRLNETEPYRIRSVIESWKSESEAVGSTGPNRVPISLAPILFPNWDIPDPKYFADQTLEFRSPIIRGTHTYTNTKAYEHSQFEEELWLKIAGEESFELKYILEMPSFTIDGHFESDLDIFSGTAYFSGQGYSHFNVRNTTLTVEAKVSLTQTPSPSIVIDELDVGFRFRKVIIDTQESYVNCLTPNWDEIGFDLTLIVETYWPFLAFRLINPILKNIFNDKLQGCDIQDIIDGDLSCLEPSALISRIQAALEAEISPIINNLPQSKAEWINPCTYNTPQPTEGTSTATTEGNLGDNDASTLQSAVTLTAFLSLIVNYIIN